MTSEPSGPSYVIG